MSSSKTEVSQDGETWYTLFDSAIEGTYTEPQDGTGKTHQIPAHLFANTDDTDTYNTLIKNGQFNGFGERLTGGASWLGSKDNGWRTYNKNQATAAIKDGRLHLNNPGGASYVEVRNTDRGYFGIADTSLKIKPNTTYRIEYDYETKYISGTHQYGFKLGVLTSDTSGNKAESFDTIPYVNTTKPLTHVTHEFTTPSNAHYANISPVIYGHWGDKNLNMQAWVDNLSLVEVLGKPDTPVPNGVRYIRDWTNKANNSTSNVWTEIQAIERNTGINRAKNIIPTTDIQNPTGNLSRLTDGSITTGWTGKSGGNKLSYMQLDLGAIYDISQIQVWHYQDGRVFSDTKTEVSPDGINWTTLHDAAIHGTYNEPRDGSGRSYGVRSEEDTSEDDEGLRELEAFLEELFGEVGIQSVDSDGVEINSSFELSFEQSELLRKFVSKAEYNKKDISKYKDHLITLKYGRYSGNQKLLSVVNTFISEIDSRKLTPQILNFEYTIDIQEGYLGGIYFETNKDVKEQGVQLVYAHGRKAYSLKFSDNTGAGKIHSAIILPDCLGGCNFYVRGYVEDFQGKIVTSEPKLIRYAGGTDDTIPYEDLLTIDYNATSIASSESIQINNVSFFTKLLAILGLTDFITCGIDEFSPCGTVIVKVGEELIKGSVSAVKTASKRVLGISSKTKVDTLAPSVGKNADEVRDSIFKLNVLKVTNYDINLIYKTQPDKLTQVGLTNTVEDMKINGYDITQPIRIYIDNGRPLIIDGHHRFVAAKQLGYSRIPIQYIQKDRIHTINGRTLEELRALAFKNGL